MKAKGCITDVLEWRSARGYFYWRIRRRQLEDQLKEQLVNDSAGTLTLQQATAKVCFLFHLHSLPIAPAMMFELTPN